VDKDQVAQLIAQSCQPGIVREDQQEQIGLLNLDGPLLIEQLHGFERQCPPDRASGPVQYAE
jgi:hypothetical protein